MESSIRPRVIPARYAGMLDMACPFSRAVSASPGS
jgi:hypothetical protein